MTHMMAQYSPVSIISLTTCQKICFNPALLVSFLYRCHGSSCLHPVLTCISLLLFPLCHPWSSHLGCALPAFVEGWRLFRWKCTSSTDAAAVLISWGKYSRLQVRWLMCDSPSKRVYIFYLKSILKAGSWLKQGGEREETSFFRVCLFSMITSHASKRSPIFGTT